MSKPRYFMMFKRPVSILVLAGILTISGCGGGSTESASAAPLPASGETPPPSSPPPNQPSPTDPGPTDPEPTDPTPTDPPPQGSSDIVPSAAAASRVLTQATFGPSLQSIEALNGNSLSDWLVNEFNKPASYHLEHFESMAETYGEEALDGFLGYELTSIAFWQHAITADDQLRQRVAFALSQILVVSNASDDLFEDFPVAVSSFQDILIQHAFGNYLDLLTDVTYSPTMGRYLTYLGNQKANPETGRVPDENYAREILQLFSTGLVGLNIDGSVQFDPDGQPIELYTNEDITGLAKVFTGLDYAYESEEEEDILSTPMTMNEQVHSSAEKSFLGYTIPANTDGTTSIQQALAHIVSQPSVAPFVARQLIQRLVTSHPEPDYIERVATAFENGEFVLPNGTKVGDGRRGGLQATVAAILADPDARYDMMSADVDLTRFGKVREPVIRFTHWARAFELAEITPELMPILNDTSGAELLNQHPYRANSVFNFFRPGYVAPGTVTGSENLTMPELQILNASSSFGYINFMTAFVIGDVQEDPGEWMDELSEDPDEPFVDLSRSDRSFLPVYSAEVALASDVSALVARLEQILFTSPLSENTRTSVIESINQLPEPNEEDDDNYEAMLRVQLAIIMLMSSPDYLVQQ